ncbi:hypothetical protein RIF29_10863 [Crotalaria pallida]|uniref:Uncharacterized protein n=1 Tax=Crotalaria pallida TaxID=3830 RepID=A0AAN9ILT0_CROPI
MSKSKPRITTTPYVQNTLAVQKYVISEFNTCRTKRTQHLSLDQHIKFAMHKMVQTRDRTQFLLLLDPLAISRDTREDAAQLHQFILHAALDVVQDLAWTTSAMYLKSVDRFNELVVSVYVTAAMVSKIALKLVKLHASMSFSDLCVRIAVYANEGDVLATAIALLVAKFVLHTSLVRCTL